MLKCGLALLVAFLSGISCQSFCVARTELFTRSEKADADDSGPQGNSDDGTQEEKRKARGDSKSQLHLQKKKVSDLSPPDAQPMLDRASDDVARERRADRQRSLHPEHDPDSPCYSGRIAPGPDHGSREIPHGPDPRDEQHHGGQDGFPSDDPYNGSTGNDKDHPNRPY